MKANKAKTSKKAEKKLSKRAVKKELESSLTDKFMDAVRGLGLDAGKLSKEIKKSSRSLAKKLSEKYKKVKVAVEEKLESNARPVKKVKKPLTSARRVPSAVEKAEKVVAQAAVAARKRRTPSKTAAAAKVPLEAIPAVNPPAAKPAVRKRTAKPAAAAPGARSETARQTGTVKPAAVKGRGRVPRKPAVTTVPVSKPEKSDESPKAGPVSSPGSSEQN